MEEIWKDIEGYEGCYQVSNKGNVKSLSRYFWNGHNWWKRGDLILAPRLSKNKKDYYSVQLVDGKGGKKSVRIHSLVAQAFIPIPDNLKNEKILFINHKDENKLNNNVDNLEWCTPTYNAKYGSLKERNSKLRKKIKFIHDTLDIEFILDEVEEYENLNFERNKVKNCIHGKRKYKRYYVKFL